MDVNYALIWNIDVDMKVLNVKTVCTICTIRKMWYVVGSMKWGLQLSKYMYKVHVTKIMGSLVLFPTMMDSSLYFLK
jgi:hypothetical protein